MEIDLSYIFLNFGEALKYFWETSSVIAFLKFFLFVYCAVLFVDIILILSHVSIIGDLKMTLFQTKRPLQKRSTLIKRYEAILERLESENESQYKAAIIEGDAFADDMLKAIGYHGGNMKERLDGIKDYQLETKPDLVEAHTLRNQIINDPSFGVTKELAEETLARYKRFFDEIELF